jgi:hypothetical protein
MSYYDIEPYLTDRGWKARVTRVRPDVSGLDTQIFFCDSLFAREVDALRCGYRFIAERGGRARNSDLERIKELGG